MVLLKITGGGLEPLIELPPSATIMELKEMLKELLNVELPRQGLSYGFLKLENDCSIGSYGFTDNTELFLLVRPLPGGQKFSIKVKSASNEEQIKVRETQLVGELREKIARHWGTPVEKVSLLRLSKEMDDNLPLSAYYITQDAEIEVRIAIEPR